MTSGDYNKLISFKAIRRDLIIIEGHAYCYGLQLQIYEAVTPVFYKF